MQKGMSALPPIADMCSALAHVRFVPIADICHILLDHLVAAVTKHLGCVGAAPPRYALIGFTRIEPCPNIAHHSRRRAGGRHEST